MANDYAWRRKFIEVIEEVFRELGFDPPAMTHDPEKSLVMELEVDGTAFEVVHNPRTNTRYCLIEARVGTIDTDRSDNVLLEILARNLDLARNFGGVFCSDIKDNAILFNVSMPLEKASGESLLQALRKNAVQAVEWRQILTGTSGDQQSLGLRVSPALA